MPINVFLGGTIDNGESVDWQAQLIFPKIHGMKYTVRSEKVCHSTIHGIHIPHSARECIGAAEYAVYTYTLRINDEINKKLRK